MGERKIQVVTDAAAVAAFAADRIVEVANQTIAREGKFSIALCSGETSMLLYDLLASDAFSRRIDWPRWEIYFTDERCIAPTAKESHFRILSEVLLDQVAIEPGNIHRMKGETEPLAAAIEYGKMLKNNFGDKGTDVAMLELGDDGEIAGLFPRSTAIDETHHRCAENQVADGWRITMTAPFINRAGIIILTAAGTDKAPLVADALEGDRDARRAPAQLINPADGELLWLMDVEAAGMNED